MSTSDFLWFFRVFRRICHFQSTKAFSAPPQKTVPFIGRSSPSAPFFTRKCLAGIPVPLHFSLPRNCVCVFRLIVRRNLCSHLIWECILCIFLSDIWLLSLFTIEHAGSKVSANSETADFTVLKMINLNCPSLFRWRIPCWGKSEQSGPLYPKNPHHLRTLLLKIT